MQKTRLHLFFVNIQRIFVHGWDHQQRFVRGAEDELPLGRIAQVIHQVLRVTRTQRLSSGTSRHKHVRATPVLASRHTHRSTSRSSLVLSIGTGFLRTILCSSPMLYHLYRRRDQTAPGTAPRKYGFDVTSVGQRKYVLTSLPLVSVLHHGRVNSVKVEINFISSASSIILVHNLCCDKCIQRTYLKVLRLSIEFLG